SSGGRIEYLRKQDRAGEWSQIARKTDSYRWFERRRGARSPALSCFRSVFELSENQPAGGGLQRAGHDHRGRLAKMRAGVIDHDHGAIGQIPDGLMLLTTFLDQSELDFIADNEHRTQRA